VSPNRCLAATTWTKVEADLLHDGHVRIIMIPGSAIEDRESASLSLSHFWEQAESCQDIESVVSREFGPLLRSPIFRNLGKNSIDAEMVNSRGSQTRNGIVRKGSYRNSPFEMDETLVTHYSLRHVAQRGTLTTRVVVSGMILAALCVASFAASTLILDTFQLRPADIQVIPPVTPGKYIASEEFTTSTTDSSDRFLEIKRKLVNVSDFTSDTLLSPRMRALDWIANKDEMKLAAGAPNLRQRYILALLFYSTGGETWKRDLNWLSNQHECYWKGEGGVRDCSRDWEVNDIALWNNLHGTIPSELFQLTKLKTLYFARNNLVGTIPSEIGLLTDLEFMGLQHNGFTGTVPTLHMGKMYKLKALNLEKNSLSGSIRKVDPLCQLRNNLERKTAVGSLQLVTADCKSLVKWKKPTIGCGCCTKCFI